MTTLYEKIGRRYHPVRDTDAYVGLPNGTWIVVVERGMTSCRRAVDGISDQEAALLSALRKFEEILAAEIQAASSLRPPQKELSAREKRAYAAFFDVMAGHEPGTIVFERDSCGGMAERAVERFRGRVEGVSRTEVNGE